MTNQKPKVAIIGAGLAGLTCANVLKENGISFNIYEASPQIGGRVKTFQEQGFLLDYGFQVMLKAYPECRRFLDYDALRLKKFIPGASVLVDGRFETVGDPFRRPWDVIKTVFSKVGNFDDKFKVLKLRKMVLSQSIEEIFEKTPPQTTLAFLQKHGFSEQMIERFFRPFLGGIFLEKGLKTDASFFLFVFKMFSEGDTAVPEEGMAAIPKQLAAGFKKSIFLNHPVRSIENQKITLENGTEVEADYIVLATDMEQAQKLLKVSPSKVAEAKNNSVHCFYFKTPKAPINSPLLLLNGSGKGIINNVVVNSLLSSKYAPEGEHLVGVSVIGKANPDEAVDQILAELRKDWFGEEVEAWTLIKDYYIHNALPAMPSENPPHRHKQAYFEGIPQNCLVCGDFMADPSINGAMYSGRIVAEKISAELKQTVAAS